MQKKHKNIKSKKVENVKKLKMQKVFAPDMSTWVLIFIIMWIIN